MTSQRSASATVGEQSSQDTVAHSTTIASDAGVTNSSTTMDSTVTTASANNGAATPPSDASLIGAIVGGVIGALVSFAIIAIVAVVLRRRRNGSRPANGEVALAPARALPNNYDSVAAVPAPAANSSVYSGAFLRSADQQRYDAPSALEQYGNVRLKPTGTEYESSVL
jgi:hypothetical protein